MCGLGSLTQLSSMRLSGPYLLAIDRPRWMPATRPTTSTHLMSPTNGVILRRGGERLGSRECTSGTRGGVVVRDGRNRPASSHCALARCGDPSAQTGTRGTMHHDHPRAGQRGCSRAGFRPDPAPFRGESGFSRKCLCRNVGDSAWPTRRDADARNLRGPRSRGRLLWLRHGVARLAAGNGAPRNKVELRGLNLLTSAPPDQANRC